MGSITKRRISRWVMYLGVFALLGALANGQPLSALASVVLVLQYPALEFYNGYRTLPEPVDAGSGAQP